MKRLSSLLLTALIALAPNGLFAQATLDCLPDKGTPGTFVYDYADILSPEEEAEFNQTIRALNDTTPNSIVVVTHPDFCGEEPFEFATGVGEKWGVGDAQFDNGIVLALSPKTAERKGQVFIAVGYGLEGAIPDITANRIIDLEMIPEFKLGGPDAYARGIDNAVAVLGPLASGEVQEYTGGELPTSVPIVLVLFVLLVFVMPVFLTLIGLWRMAKDNDLGTLAALMLLASRSRSRGSYGHFKGGSGSFGGSGGFGGGSFGGGGAGGSW